MKAAFYSGSSGIRAQQLAMDVIGNNLANSNTQGYQPKTVSFQQLLNNEMYKNKSDSPLVGNGARAVDTGIQVGKGSQRQTGSPLDFSILGEGFFAVKYNDEVQYTRDGTFGIVMDDDEAYLGTVDGAYVLDEDGKRIEITKSKDGAYDYQELQHSIGVYTFPQPSALTPVSNNCYSASTKSGKAVSLDEEDKQLLQGFLENSGVVMVEEMTNLITVQRAFQLSARVLQTADENEQTINNLRK